MYRHFIRGPDVSPEVIWPVSLYHVHAPSLVSLTPGMTPGRAEDLARAGANSIGIAVLGALLGFLSVVILAVLIVTTYKHCVCERVSQPARETDRCKNNVSGRLRV